MKCPLSQNCLINNIIYKVVLTSTNPCYKEKIYFSTAENTFKLWYSNHQTSFKFIKYKRDIELSNELWQMKKSTSHHLEIVRKGFLCSFNSKSWYFLYLNGKLETVPTGEVTCWRKKQLLSKWRHRNKYSLSKLETKCWRQLYCKKPSYCNFPFVKHIQLKIVG